MKSTRKSVKSIMLPLSYSLHFISLLLLLTSATTTTTAALDKACPIQDSSWTYSNYQNYPLKAKNYKSATTCDGQQLICESFPCHTVNPVNYVTQFDPYTFNNVPNSVNIFNSTSTATVNLECSITLPTCYRYKGEYCPKVLWVRDYGNGSEKILSSFGFQRYSSTLQVRSNGTYYCKVNGTVNYNEWYSIVSPPATVTFQPNTGHYHWSNSIYDSPSVYDNAGNTVTLYVPRGGSAFLDCTTDEPFTERIWTYVTQGNEEVKIITDFNNKNTYVCQIKNTHAVRTFSLEFYEGPPIQLQSFLVSPKSQNISKGSNITLYCLANTTISELTYTWYINNSTVIIPSGDRHMLVLQSIQDSAYYSCVVRDTVNGSSIQATAYIRVFDKPSVTINWYISPMTPFPPTLTPNGINVLDININDTGGDTSRQNSLNLTLVCRVDNEDQPLQYRWYFRGNPIFPCPECPILLNSTSLFFNYSIPVKDIIGSVQCLVGGFNGWGSSQVRIKIKDKPNPPDDSIITELQPNDLFQNNTTLRIEWSPPSTGIRPIGYRVIIIHTIAPNNKECLQLRTTSTCILVDKFCDILLSRGHVDFLVSSVGGGGGGGGGGTTYSDDVVIDSSNVYTGLSNLAQPRYPLRLKNRYTTVPSQRNNQFVVTFLFDSLTKSYSSYYDRYQSNDILEEYYHYKLGVVCVDKISGNITDKSPPTSDIRASNDDNYMYTGLFGCKLSCSWNVTLMNFNDLFVQKTNITHFTTPSIFPSQSGVINKVSWIGNTGTDFEVFLELPPDNILCGLLNVTLNVTCNSNTNNPLISYRYNSSSTSITGSLSDQYCWEQCNISYTYTNSAGTSDSSNVVSLPTPLYSNTAKLLSRIDATRINNTAINITWSLSDGNECLIRKYYFNNDTQVFYWYPGLCSSKLNKTNSLSGTLSLLRGYTLLMIDTKDSQVYCFQFNGYQYSGTIASNEGSSTTTTTTSTVSPTGSPVGGNSQTSSNKMNYIIIGSSVGGVAAFIIIIVILLMSVIGSCMYIKIKRKQQQFLIQRPLNESNEESSLPLLKDDQISLTSEKTDYQKLESAKYDEEQMRKFLDSTINYTSPTTHGSRSTLIEFEPSNKGKVPNRNQPRPSVKKEQKLLQSISSISLQQPLPRQSSSSRQPLVTVSALVHDDTSGYCRTMEDMSTAAINLNKTTPTNYVSNQGVELEQFEFTEPGEEEFETNKIHLFPSKPTPINRIATPTNNLAPPINNIPMDSFGDYVSNTQLPPFSRQATPTQLTSGRNSRSSELTPTPSTSSSMVSIATVGRGSDNRDSGERKNSTLSNFKDRRHLDKRGLRRHSKSYNRRASNRSSPSSGILSSGGSSDSVFQSSSSSSVNDSRLSRSRKSSGFGSAPVTPRSSGPTCNDNTHFPFPPPPPPPSLTNTTLSSEYIPSLTGVLPSKLVNQPSFPLPPISLSSSHYIPCSQPLSNTISSNPFSQTLAKANTNTLTNNNTLSTPSLPPFHTDTHSKRQSIASSTNSSQRLPNFTYSNNNNLQSNSVSNTGATPYIDSFNSKHVDIQNTHLQNTGLKQRVDTGILPVETGSYITNNSLGTSAATTNRRKSSTTIPNLTVGDQCQLVSESGYMSDSNNMWSHLSPSLLGRETKDSKQSFSLSNKPNFLFSLNDTSPLSSLQTNNFTSLNTTNPFSDNYLPHSTYTDRSFLLPSTTRLLSPITDVSGSSTGSTPVNPPITPLSPSSKTPTINQPSIPLIPNTSSSSTAPLIPVNATSSIPTTNSKTVPLIPNTTLIPATISNNTTLLKGWTPSKIPTSSIVTLSSPTSIRETPTVLPTPMLTTPLKVTPLKVLPTTPLIDPLNSKLKPSLPAMTVSSPPKVPQLNTTLKSPLAIAQPLPDTKNDKFGNYLHTSSSSSSSSTGYMTLPAIPHTVNHLSTMNGSSSSSSSSYVSRQDINTVLKSPIQSLSSHSNNTGNTQGYTCIPSLYGYSKKSTVPSSKSDQFNSELSNRNKLNTEPPTQLLKDPPTRSNSEVTDESYSLCSISSSMNEFIVTSNNNSNNTEPTTTSKDRSNSEISYSLPDDSNSLQDLLDDELLLNNDDDFESFHEEENQNVPNYELGDYIHTVQPNDYISS